MRYEISNSIINRIKISDDLKEISFQCSSESTKEVVGKILFPAFPAIGYAMHSRKSFKVFRMSDLSLMPPSRQNFIDSVVKIGDEKHTIEFILINARNAGFITNECYRQIRLDIANKIDEFRKEFRLQQEYVLKQLEELSLKYSEMIQQFPKTNFKKIAVYSDAKEFEGRIVAFQASSYYYTGSKSITSPADNSTQFGVVGSLISKWNGAEFGTDMDVYIEHNSVGSVNALIPSE